MGCKAGQCKTSSPYDIFIMTPSLKEWQTKAKEATSPQVKTGPNGHSTQDFNICVNVKELLAQI